MNADDRESSMTFHAVHENRPSSPEVDTSPDRPTSVPRVDSSASEESRDEHSDDEFAKEFFNLRSSQGSTEVAQEVTEGDYFTSKETNGHDSFATFADFNSLQHNPQADLLDIGPHSQVTKDRTHSITETLDLLNLGVAHKHEPRSPKPAVDSGIDLLKLSTSPKQHQHFDLVGGLDKHKRNRSADDLLKSPTHEDDDFFKHLGSRSSGSSLENLVSPTGSTSPSFDPFGLKLSPQAHHPADSQNSFDPFEKKVKEKSSGGGRKETFDPFNKSEKPLSPEASSKDMFDPFGAMASLSQNHNAFENKRGKSPVLSGTGIPVNSTNNRSSPVPNAFTSTTQNVPDLFGGTDSKGTQAKKNQFTIGDDIFSVGGSFESKPSNQPRPDLLGDWGEAFKSDVQLNPVPSPLATPPSTRKSEKANPATNDPFADFGNIMGQGGASTAFPSNQKFPSNQNVSSPSQQRKPFGGQTWQTKAQAKPSRESPKKPQQTFTQSKAKPNYTPSYSAASGGSSVFGEYGLRTSHSKC